jgi:hypothetical protein
VPGEALPHWAVRVENEAQAQRLHSTAGSASDIAASGKRASVRPTLSRSRQKTGVNVTTTLGFSSAFH